MSTLYGQQHLELQRDFGTAPLAERIRQMIVAEEIAEEHKAFIESRDMFFLSTIDHRGFPTCSYKGGTPGFVRVLDGRTLAFPSYDGNGMYLSLGNMRANPKVGLLFIDFETPHRVRVHGIATVQRDDPLHVEFPGAEMLVRIRVEEIFINCPRYIHRYQRVEDSPYAPRPGCEPPAPQWKRIDALQDVLPERDRVRAERLGGPITPAEYEARVRSGKG